MCEQDKTQYMTFWPNQVLTKSSVADHLETCSRIVSEDYKLLLEQTPNQSEKLKTIGAAFTQLWGEHELSNTSTSTMYQTVGDVWNYVSKILEKEHVNDPLDLPLEELLLDVMNLKAALAKRKKFVYEYTKKKQQGQTISVEMDKLKAVSDLSKHQERYFQIERELRANDAQERALQTACELISNRLTTDIDRFRVEWHGRMRSVLHDFHTYKMSLLQEQYQQYARALPVLQGMHSDRADIPKEKVFDKPEMEVSFDTIGAKVSFAGTNNATTPTSLYSLDPISLDESIEKAVPAPASAPPPPPTDLPPPPPAESPLPPGDGEDSSSVPKMLSV